MVLLAWNHCFRLRSKNAYAVQLAALLPDIKRHPPNRSTQSSHTYLLLTTRPTGQYKLLFKTNTYVFFFFIVSFSASFHPSLAFYGILPPFDYCLFLGSDLVRTQSLRPFRDTIH